MYTAIMVSIPVNTDSSSDAVLDLLFQLKVKDVMTAPVITVSPEITMREIQCLMKTKNITGVLVLRDAKLEGIVSMDDIINAFDGGWIDEAAELHMTKDLIVLIDSMPLTFCVSSFNKYHFGRFPVLNSDNELCGIVTTTDVIAALLTAMNKVVEKMEKDKNQQEPKENTVAAERIIEFRTESFNFDTAGKASTEIKKIMKNMGVPAALTRRIGIASYELEINQVVHSQGGVMRYYIRPDKLVIEAQDFGPGIPDIAKVLIEGYSTADDRIRALGFGAGMGLPNTKRVSDEFNIVSEVDKGTVVHAVFNLKEGAV